MQADVPASIRADAGMTVLEVMIVLVILSLIAVVGTVQIGHLLDRSKVDVAKIQLQQLANSLEVYQLDFGSFPTADAGLESLVTNPDTLAAWRGPYLRNRDLLLDPWGQPIKYTIVGSGFTLTSMGADRKEGGDDIASDLVASSDG